MVEAERFLKRVEEYVNAQGEDQKREYPYMLPKESGAVKRSSMDLTRALADLRQGR